MDFSQKKPTFTLDMRLYENNIYTLLLELRSLLLWNIHRRRRGMYI
ncbi:MAG: hypothetical protein SNH13_02850 [Rikenellaceae bacterium]